MKKLTIDEGNKYIKKLKYYLRSSFTHPPKKFYLYIINNCNEIINLNKLPLSIFKTDKEFNQLVKYNKSKLFINDDIYYVNDNDKNKIIEILNDYLISLTSPKIDKSSFEKDYVNINTPDEDDLNDDDYITPNNKTVYQDVLKNLFYNNDVNFKYNKKIENLSPNNNMSDEIKNYNFKIHTKGEDVYLPTKYEWVCRAHTDYGECGNIVCFYKGHLHNIIKCVLGSNKTKGHSLKSPEKIPPKESRLLYCYYLIPNDNREDNKELLAFSFTPINKELFKANYIKVVDKTPYILLLGFEYEDNNNEDVVITITKEEDNSLCFIDNIYNGIKRYYKTYHNLTITDSNKFLGWCLILQIICKIYLNHRYHLFCPGQSGSGKTFLAEHIIKLFTFNYKFGMGSSITKNKFLGGRSNVNSDLFNSLYEPGFIETKDVLVLDECTELLDMIANPKIANFENLYVWIKLADQIIDRGIQGSRDIMPNAVLILFGNLQQLKYMREEYLREVKKKYKLLTNGKVIDERVSLYKPPEYYLEELKNEELAKAHSLVRRDIYKDYHYILGLAEAEMSRFTFFIGLDDDDEGYSDKQFTGVSQKLNKNIHRDIFITQMDDIFKNIKQPPIEFRKEVWEWLNDYFKTTRSNYRSGDEKDINMHMFIRVVAMITDLLYLNKIFYNKPIKLDENDKILANTFLRFNYNVLGKKEAMMLKQPYINDGCFNIDELREFDSEKKEQYKVNLHKKALEQKDKEEDVIAINEKGDEAEMFGSLPEDEFK